MIFINPLYVNPPIAWKTRARKLGSQLIALAPADRPVFIEKNRVKTWGDPRLVAALTGVVGNKCWYSEVCLTGNDPNVDHFFPKGRVKVVDINNNFSYIRDEIGYWWWAFELRNYRLSSEHTNQRRNGPNSHGGKSDYFPVIKRITISPILYSSNPEDHLALDPCDSNDVKYLWFSNDGMPLASGVAIKNSGQDRVKTTIWLYHLNHPNLVSKRLSYINELDILLEQADERYADCQSDRSNIIYRKRFQEKINLINAKLDPRTEMVAAKLCFLRSMITEYEWLEEYINLAN